MFGVRNIRAEARAVYIILLYRKPLGSLTIVPLRAIAATCGEFGPNPKDETIVYYNVCNMYIII